MLNNKYYNNELKEKEERKISLLLKNKRIEQGKKLEDVARGICSTSYLSRIENNQVKLQDPYLKMLFEKLDIDYDELKNERKHDLFTTLLKLKILSQEDKYQELITKAINSKCYLGIERDLILLFDNINNGRYEEAFILSNKIEEIIQHLSNSEIVFYMYLLTKLYLNTNQISNAYRQINILRQVEITENLVQAVSLEIALTIYFEIGDYALFTKTYIDFIQNNSISLFMRSQIINKMRLLTIEMNLKYDVLIEKMNELYYESNDDSMELKENYYFYSGLIYLKQKQYDEIIKLVSKHLYSERLASLLSIALNKTENPQLQELALNLINNYSFNKYELINKNFCYYHMMKFRKMNITWLNNYLKNHVYLLLKNSFHDYLYYEIIKELITIQSRCSKYKEACNLSIHYLEGLKNSMLNS